ncbi:MAG TPA: hypothetical protein VKQ06_12590 [Gammaproteobacteria bacterium]|nr:hypothetical protein [Gammaproteobacteria bacterium]
MYELRPTLSVEPRPGERHGTWTTLLLLSLSGALIALVWSPDVSAQWPEYEDPALPRDAQGNVLMDAPPPRMLDGTPDLSGLWMRTRSGPPPESQGGGGLIDVPTEPVPLDPDAPPIAAFFEAGENIEGGLPYTPWAKELRDQRFELGARDNPDANCMPMGFLQFHQQPQPRMIIHTEKMILIEYEANYGVRHIYLDGRELPPQGEPQPWWYGYSVGHWEDDDLVVETNNLRGADEDSEFDGWLDVNGSPYTREAKFIERFRRPTFGHLQIDITVDDPKGYTRPWTVRVDQRLLPDQELIEFICNENQQFRQRIQLDEE